MTLPYERCYKPSTSVNTPQAVLSLSDIKTISYILSIWLLSEWLTRVLEEMKRDQDCGGLIYFPPGAALPGDVFRTFLHLLIAARGGVSPVGRLEMVRCAARYLGTMP
jgi:hypothetical protein